MWAKEESPPKLQLYLQSEAHYSATYPTEVTGLSLQLYWTESGKLTDDGSAESALWPSVTMS